MQTTNRRWIAVVLIALTTGCGGYSGASPRAYEYAKALYSICNRQADEKLVEVTTQIEADVATEEISPREAGWLKAIVDDAEAGDWKAAMNAARQLMEDQTAMAER